MLKPLSLLPLALVFAPVSCLAAGQLITSTLYQSHPVAGATASAIYRNMNRHPIVDPDDGPALADLTHDHDAAIAVAPTAKGCAVSDLKFTWHFVITLPEAIDAAHLAPRSRAAWIAFLATLKHHEEHHRSIFLHCGQNFVPAAAKLTGPCSTLKADVQSYITTQYAQCMTTQHAFDAADDARVYRSPFIRLALAERQSN